MKKNAHYLSSMGRKTWMKKTYSCVSEGGFLPFYKDEMLPSEAGIKSVEELREYIEVTGDDADFLMQKWRDKADLTVTVPTILTVDHCFENDLKYLPKEVIIDSDFSIRSMVDNKRKKLRSLGEKFSIAI